MTRSGMFTHPGLIPESIETVILRVVQRELSRSRTSRQRSNRRRVASQRVRDFEKAALAAVIGSYRP